MLGTRQLTSSDVADKASNDLVYELSFPCVLMIIPFGNRLDDVILVTLDKAVTRTRASRQCLIRPSPVTEHWTDACWHQLALNWLSALLMPDQMLSYVTEPKSSFIVCRFQTNLRVIGLGRNSSMVPWSESYNPAHYRLDYRFEVITFLVFECNK